MGVFLVTEYPTNNPAKIETIKIGIDIYGKSIFGKRQKGTYDICYRITNDWKDIIAETNDWAVSTYSV